MRILIATPTPKYNLVQARWFNCAGLTFKNIHKLKKYTEKDDRGNIYFVHKTTDLNLVELKRLVDHWNKHDSHRTLRYGEHGLLKEVESFFNNVKSIQKLTILHDSLMIYYTIKKYGDVLYR
jgi:hypothetical protein